MGVVYWWFSSCAIRGVIIRWFDCIDVKKYIDILILLLNWCINNLIGQQDDLSGTASFANANHHLSSSFTN